MRILARFGAFLFLLPLVVQPATAQLGVGVDLSPETIRALNEAELARFVIIVGAVLSFSMIGTLSSIVVMQHRASGKRAAEAEADKKRDDERWQKRYENDRSDREAHIQALVRVSDAGHETALALQQVRDFIGGQADLSRATVEEMAANRRTNELHDKNAIKRHDELTKSIEGLAKRVDNGYARLSKAMQEGVETGVQRGIVHAAEMLKAVFQPLVDRIERMETKTNVQTTDDRGTGAADGGAGGGASDTGAGGAGGDNAV